MGASQSKDKMHCTRYLNGKGPPPLGETAETQGTKKHKKTDLIKQGNQPDGGQMNYTIERRSLPGYPGCDTIQITFHFDDGIQSDMHPHPGHSYRGNECVAYLPQNTTGTKIFRLLEQAFKHKLLFTVAANISGEYCVTPADIPLKTQNNGGPGSFGYPDPDYLKSVRKTCLVSPALVSPPFISYLTSSHLVSSRLTCSRLISSLISPAQLISFRLVSPDLVLSYLFSSHFLSHQLSSRLVSSHLISSRLTCSRLISSLISPAQLISFRLVSPVLVLSYLFSSHLLSHLLSSHLLSPHLFSSHLTCSHLVSPSSLDSYHFTSSRLISYLTCSHLISSHLLTSHLI
ncbi:unnamed protein product [Leuciscus chuanchicus]